MNTVRLLMYAAMTGILLTATAGVLLAQSVGSSWTPLLPNQKLGADGVFDPSLALGDEGQLYLSFSAVNPNSAHPPPHNRSVSTYLARSNDGGRIWNVLDRPANAVKNIQTKDEVLSWHHEVSALLYDGMATSQPYILLSHHYPKRKGKRLFEHGWIALKTAKSLDALTMARETKLFVGKAYSPNAAEPVTDDAVLELQSLHKDLAHCAVLTEPALLAHEQSIFLALTCVEARLFWRVNHKIILLKCNRPCIPGKGDAWQYVATLLSKDDSAEEKANYYTAADMVFDDKTTWLIASPVSDKPFNDAYNGCDVFRFADITKGELARQNGKIRRSSHLEGSPASFSGACSRLAKPNLTLLSQLSIRNGRAHFQIMRQTEN